MSKYPEPPKDRTGRQIELGDYVAFDYVVAMATAESEEMWDILWGVAEETGINVLVDPLTGRENQIFSYAVEPSQMLIIKKKNISLEDLAKKFKTKSAEEILASGAEIKTAEELGMTQEEVDEFIKLEEKARQEGDIL